MKCPVLRPLSGGFRLHRGSHLHSALRMGAGQHPRAHAVRDFGSGDITPSSIQMKRVSHLAQRSSVEQRPAEINSTSREAYNCERRRSFQRRADLPGPATPTRSLDIPSAPGVRCRCSACGLRRPYTIQRTAGRLRRVRTVLNYDAAPPDR